MKEKQCPYCAETILADAIKCRYCSSELVADEFSNNADEQKPQSGIVACSECNVALVSTQKTKAVSFSGVIGALLFLAGIFTFLHNMIVGILIVILALIVSVTGRQKTVMVCPSCRKEGATIA